MSSEEEGALGGAEGLDSKNSRNWGEGSEAISSIPLVMDIYGGITIN